MNSLQVDQSNNTPRVLFNPQSGNLELSGKCIPENSKAFFQSIYAWMREYANSPAASTTVNVQLDYFNTSSAKCIFDLFRMLDQLQQEQSSQVTINWNYHEDDSDMLEVGEDFQKLLKSTFNLISFTN